MTSSISNSSNASKIKLIVYVNLFLLTLATVYIIYRTINLTSQLQSKPSFSTHLEGPEVYNHKIIKQQIVYLLVTWAFVFGITATINLVLLKGVYQRSSSKCLIWFGINAFGTTVQIYKIVMCFVSGDYGEGVYLLAWAGVSLYGLYVVKGFMEEIKGEGGNSGGEEKGQLLNSKE